MPDVPFYAPKPDNIKTIIVVETNGACVTYPDLLSAITAVYRLHPTINQLVTDLVHGSNDLNELIARMKEEQH